jgi:hypothetical protein
MAKVRIRFEQTTPAQRRKMIRELEQSLDVNESLEALIQAMHAYEAQFGMSTVEFYARYSGGKMGDSREVMGWAGAFEDYQALLHEHFRHVAA